MFCVGLKSSLIDKIPFWHGDSQHQTGIEDDKNKDDTDHGQFTSPRGTVSQPTSPKRDGTRGSIRKQLKSTLIDKIPFWHGDRIEPETIQHSSSAVGNHGDSRPNNSGNSINPG